MSEQVIAVLFQFLDVSNGVIQIMEMAKMSIRECLDLAVAVNTTEPNHIVLCAPDLMNIPVEH